MFLLSFNLNQLALNLNSVSLVHVQIVQGQQYAILILHLFLADRKYKSKHYLYL